MATAQNTLSDKAIKAAIRTAQAEGKARKISDGGGLVLDVRPTGTGWWRMRYWLGGKEGMLSLGTYPVVGLSDARGRRDEARTLLAQGINPSDQRKADKERKEAADANTVEAVGGPTWRSRRPGGQPAITSASAASWAKTCSPTWGAGLSPTWSRPSC